MSIQSFDNSEPGRRDLSSGLSEHNMVAFDDEDRPILPGPAAMPTRYGTGIRGRIRQLQEIIGRHEVLVADFREMVDDAREMVEVLTAMAKEMMGRARQSD